MENMKQFYSRFRVMLLTFTLGLAVAPFSNALYEKWSEIPIDLPVIESDSPIVVMVPTERRPINMHFDNALITSGKFLSDGLGEKSKGKETMGIFTKGSLKDCLLRSK